MSEVRWKREGSVTTARVNKLLLCRQGPDSAWRGHSDIIHNVKFYKKLLADQCITMCDTDFKNVNAGAGEAMIAKKDHRKRNPWMTNTILKLMEEKRKAKTRIRSD